MKRRAFLAGGLSCALAPGRTLAQRPRVPRIGYLLVNALQEPPSRERRAFLDGLREHGYVPGKTIDIDYASAEGEAMFLGDVAADLLKRGVAVLAASSAPALLAAKKLTSTVPIVMLAIGDPVGLGAVRSLSRPEGNITGVTFLSSELTAKRLELLRTLVPSARRIMLLWDVTNANARLEAAVAREVAHRHSLEVVPVPAAHRGDIENAMARMRSERVDALYVAFEGTLIGQLGATIAEGGRVARVPVVSGWSGIADAGGLLSYAPDVISLYRRAASYVHRILNGARPADLPIEQANTIELVVNAATARQIGIVVPRELLLRADRVIQ